MTIITTELISKIREHYSLNWYGTHGCSHWARVYENGLKLSVQEGVNPSVVQLFSVFHDSQRKNEYSDPQHGPRAAKLVLELREHLPLDDEEILLLTTACSLHTSATTSEDYTIGCCLDSDRMDLMRIGTVPHARFMSTPMAKIPQTIEWAMKRGLERMMPENAFGIVGYNGDIG